jgi:ferredoxin
MPCAVTSLTLYNIGERYLEVVRVSDEIQERVVGDITIKIDRSICVGFGHCIDEAQEAFRLEDDNLVTFADPDLVARDRLVAACEACPVGALSVVGAAGEQLV